MFDNPVLKGIAEAHNKTAAQIILRWNLQRGVAIIPKSIHKNRMEVDLDVWDFELSDEERRQIASLDIAHPQMLDPLMPSEVRRLYDYLNNPVLTTLQ